MPRQIILTSQLETPIFAAPSLPSYYASSRQISRKRQTAQISIPKAKQLKELGEIPEPLTKTHDGQTFLFYDSGISASRMLIFATAPTLDLLVDSEIWHCDGTFSVSPDVFYQVYTIHGMVENTLVPLVYALLPNKTQATYEELFSKFDKIGEKVNLDFELAPRNAVKKLSPGTKIRFCFFHLSQAVWRHVQRDGFPKLYVENENFRTSVKKLLCLAFVPIHDVIAGFEILRKENFDESYQKICDYFEETYIGAWRGYRRTDPKFHLEEWNLYERVLAGEARTNNAIEGWNSNFNKFVQNKYPTLPKLIQKFREEQKNAEMNVERILAGEKVKRTNNKAAAANQKLLDIVENYEKQKISFTILKKLFILLIHLKLFHL